MSDPLDAVIAEPYHLTCAVAYQSDTDKHLPECELATGVYDDRADCICDALRACELRVRTEPFDSRQKSHTTKVDTHSTTPNKHINL